MEVELDNDRYSVDSIKTLNLGK